MINQIFLEMSDHFVEIFIPKARDVD